MRVAENTWWVGKDILTFHGFWRQSKNPGVIFKYVENGDIKTLRLHFAYVNAVIGDEWMQRKKLELTTEEKEQLLIKRNGLSLDKD